jgi:rSAM/selenodomain-associated transferase 2
MDENRTVKISPPDISIIIPTLNEADNLTAILSSIQGSTSAEIIVVDGGSKDGTVRLAKAFGVKILTEATGRAGQLNSGVMAASGDVLLFLHADTRLPEDFDQYVLSTLSKPGTVAGAFGLAIDDPQVGLRIIEQLANFRSRFMRMPYGDQVIFLRKDTFNEVGGFPKIPVMEDFAFMQRLRRMGRVEIAPVAATTSARRWQELGILKTTLINQLMILAYFLRVDPDRLERLYKRLKAKN